MWNRKISRRGFVAASVAACVAAPGLGARSASTRLRIYLAVPAARPGLAEGATLGVEEVGRTATLVGASVDMTLLDPGSRTAAVGATDQLAAIVGGHDAASVRELAALAVAANVPLVNVGASDDALRAELCASTTFHVAPSDAMLADALRLSGTDAAPGRTAAAWHESLTRFGAEQLTDRFRARFGRGMTSDAWCAWMALKTLGDAALRSRATSGAELVTWLASPRARFDGHKGVPLTFRARSRQLRQPLYVVAGERVTAEVPGSARDDDRSPAARLDDLGPGDRAGECPAPLR